MCYSKCSAQRLGVFVGGDFFLNIRENIYYVTIHQDFKKMCILKYQNKESFTETKRAKSLLKMRVSVKASIKVLFI